MRFKKVEERPDLIRDEQTNAILNIDNQALKAYKNRKKQMEKINNLDGFREEVKKDINNLKNEIQSLKELVLMSLENKG